MFLRVTVRCLAAFLAIGASGCFPYRGSGQIPIPARPISIVDDMSHEPIEEVLIVPRYSSSVGFGLGVCSDTGVSSYRSYLSNPFVYRPDAAFHLDTPKSTGMVFGLFWGFLGKTASLEGVLVVAPGYQPCYTGALWDRSLHPGFELISLPAVEAAEHLEYLHGLLQQSAIEGVGTRLWGMSERLKLEIRFTPAERGLVQRFLARGISRLGGAKGQPVAGSWMPLPAVRGGWWDRSGRGGARGG